MEKMEVIVYYDERTTQILDKFKSLLKEYETELKKRISDTKYLGHRDRHELFDDDPGRNEILRQITKVKSLSIPIAIEIKY